MKWSILWIYQELKKLTLFHPPSSVWLACRVHQVAEDFHPSAQQLREHLSWSPLEHSRHPCYSAAPATSALLVRERSHVPAFRSSHVSLSFSELSPTEVISIAHYNNSTKIFQTSIHSHLILYYLDTMLHILLANQYMKKLSFRLNIILSPSV